MIRCRMFYNTPCLKCKKVKPEMIRIGAFCMCPKCFDDEFSATEFQLKSKDGKKYYKWLKVYKDNF